MDSAARAAVERTIEALIFEPAMKPVEDALGPLGSTVFASIMRRCSDAGGS